jgi:thiol-disulfide isomerase/thioredoxin
VNANYTVVVFWDPTCGHCKQEIPKLILFFRPPGSNTTSAIYGVLTENVKPEWINYIKEHQLNDWVHVYQTKEMEAAEVAAQKASFRQLYDVTITPKLYLLDKDKRIIAKGLDWKQLNDPWK